MLIVTFRRQHEEPRAISSYEVKVRVTTSATSAIAVAEPATVQHRRVDGWAVLVARYLKQQHPAAWRQVADEPTTTGGQAHE